MPGTSKDAALYEPYTLNTEKRYSKGRTDTACDFYLPDYMGDVKRIMTTTAHAMCAGYTEADGAVSFSAIVGYNVLYLDSENKLTEAEFTSDLQIDAPKDAPVSSATVRLDVASLSVRAAGPRKLSAKASVSAEVSMLTERSMPPEALTGEREVRSEQIEIYSPEYMEPKEVELAEEIAFIEDVSAEEVEVISCKANQGLPKWERDGDGVRVDAEIDGECILLLCGETYCKKSGKLKLSTLLEGEGMAPMYDDVKIEVTSVTASVNNSTRDEDMKIGASVVVNIVCEVSARHDKNESRRIVTDAFCPQHRSELQQMELKYDELVCKRTVRQELSFDTALDEVGIESLAEVLLTNCQLKLSGVKCENGLVSAEGDLLMSSVGMLSGGGFTSFKCSYPLKLTEKMDCREDAALLAGVRLGNIECHFDSERVYYNLSCELVVRGLCQRIKTAIASVEEGEELADDGYGVTVYFPRMGDTVFSVAKKYAVKQQKIADRNGIAAETFSGGDTDISLEAGKPIIIDKIF